MKSLNNCNNFALLGRLRFQKSHRVVTGLLLGWLTLGQIQGSRADDQALADLSLEELAALPVISVSRKAKPVATAPASIFVITENDVRRSGVTTLPEALRLAPNLQVARVDARNYAVTARGFNNPLANKLLVMIDGRNIYSPLFSGVFWDAQDLVLEDLERIEVVSGPGGTLWGANAVNGVVNIVTRSAADTQGEMISLGASENERHGAVRYGGSFNEEGHYRVYAKTSQHDDTMNAEGESTETGWERTQAGFRTDWGDHANNFTLQGDAYDGRLHQRGTDDISISGANVLVRGTRELESGSSLKLQAYFDHTERDQPGAFSQRLNAVDIDLQHESQFGTRNKFVWGGGYRHVSDRMDAGEAFAFLPEDIDMEWSNLFVQNEIALTERLDLTLGIKVEDNPFTGVEDMPGMQLAWTPGENKLVWGSLSRAVRSPSRIDRDYYSPANPPVIDGVPLYLIAGGKDFVSEVADVFELGYRSQPVARVSWSITGFYSEYDKLRTLESNDNGSGLVFENQAMADTYGVEMWGSWQLAPNWRLHGGLVAQEFDVQVKPGSTDVSNATAVANSDPQYYGLLRSSYEVSSRVSVDSTLRYVGELETAEVPAYTTLDLRVSWRLGKQLELSLVGQNLLESSHPEFSRAPGRSEFERAVYGKLVWGL